MEQKGVKHDGGKTMLALCPPQGIELLGQAMTYGAKKYGQFNYLGGLSSIRLLSACLRHVYAFLRGRDADEESGISHLGHAMACLAMLAEMMEHRPDLDDRFKPEPKAKTKVVKEDVKQTNGDPRESYL